MTITPNPSQEEPNASKPTVAERGLGLFGSPENAALLDWGVALAYAARRGSARFPKLKGPIHDHRNP